MNPDVVHQFVFSLERFPFPGTLFPEADVVRLLGPPHVLHRQVGHQLVHRAERFVARLLGVGQLLRLDPLADQLLLDRLPHVPKEGPGPVVRRGHIHVHGAVAVQLARRIVVGPRARHVAVLVGPTVHVSGEAQSHLPVHHVGGRVARRLLVEPREEQVPRGLGVSVRPRETSRGGREQAVLRAGGGGVSEAPISEKKVPCGVEGGGGVGADVRGVAMVVVVVVSEGRRRRVAGRLGGERRLSGADVVGAVVDFEGAHPVRERVDAQRDVSVRHFAC